jgi:hypothetical protein
MATPISAAIAIPATAPLLRDEESSELPLADRHAFPEQVESESLEVIVTMSSSAFSSQAHADTLKMPRS